MKLSEYLRENQNTKSPFTAIICTNIVGNIQTEYGEIYVMDKVDTPNANLYHIRYLSDYCGHKSGDICIVDDAWCSKYDIVKLYL